MDRYSWHATLPYPLSWEDDKDGEKGLESQKEGFQLNEVNSKPVLGSS